MSKSMQPGVACASRRPRASVSLDSASAVREPRDSTVPVTVIRPVAAATGSRTSTQETLVTVTPL